MAPLMERHHHLRPRTTPHINPLTWGIVAVVIVAVALLAAIAYLVLDRRRSHVEYHQALARDPYLTRREFARRRKMSTLQRVEEEEAQRRVMIRKSLASRSGTDDSQFSLRGSSSSTTATTAATTPKPGGNSSLLSSSSLSSPRSSSSSASIPPLPAFFAGASSSSNNGSWPRRGRDYTMREWAGASVPSLTISWAPDSVPPSRYGSRVALRDEWEAGMEREQDRSDDDDDSSTNRIPLVHASRRHTSGGGGDVVVAPQLPRLPSFQDLNDDWRRSTGPAFPQQQQQQQHRQLGQKHGWDLDMAQRLTLAPEQLPAAFLHPLLRRQSLQLQLQ